MGTTQQFNRRNFSGKHKGQPGQCMYRNVKKQHKRRETVGLIHEIGSGVSRFHRCAVKMLQSLQVHHKGK